MHLNHESILAIYPDCRQAIAWCELCIDDDDWADLREIGPAATLEAVREVLEEMIAAGEGPPSYTVALAQTGTASFAVYLRGRMGMM